jgi:hypothetical protein
VVVAAQLVARAANGQAAAPPVAPGYPPPPRLVEPVFPPGAPRVTLQVDAPDARLQARVARSWLNVCDAPCGVVLDPTLEYRVGGGSVRGSAPFTLPRQARDVVVEVRAGSATGHWMGLGLMIGGAALAGVSMFVYFTDGVAGSPRSPHVGRNAAIAISIGAVLEAIGIPLWFSRTAVNVR